MEKAELDAEIERFVRMAEDFDRIKQPDELRTRFESVVQLVDLVTAEPVACEIVEIDSDAELVLLDSDQSLVRLRRDQAPGPRPESFPISARREEAGTFTVSVVQEMVPRLHAGMHGDRDWTVRFMDGEEFSLTGRVEAGTESSEDRFGRLVGIAAGFVIE